MVLAANYHLPHRLSDWVSCDLPRGPRSLIICVTFHDQFCAPHPTPRAILGVLGALGPFAFMDSFLH